MPLPAHLHDDNDHDEHDVDGGGPQYVTHWQYDHKWQTFFAGQAAEEEDIEQTNCHLVLWGDIEIEYFQKWKIFFISCTQSGLCGETSNDWWIHEDLILTRKEISLVNTFLDESFNLILTLHTNWKYAPSRSYSRISFLQKQVILWRKAKINNWYFF